MKGWALWLSLAAFVSALARAFLDWGYVLPEFTDMRSATAIAGSLVGYLALYALWVWALIVAVRGGRGGMIATLVFDVGTLVGWGLGTVFFLCPTPCPTIPPVSDVAIWSNVVFGAAASVAVFRGLR